MHSYYSLDKHRKTSFKNQMFIKIYLGYNNQEKNIYKIILLNERSKYLKKLNELLNKNLIKFSRNGNIVF